MNQALIDIECYINYFLLGLWNYQTKEKSSFEISEDIDQRKELYLFLRDYDGFWITFNGIHYDNIVLAYGQQNSWWPKDSWEQVCFNLKRFSDSIINDDESNFDRLKQYKYFRWKFTNIDLFLYWSKGLRQSKKISLKGLGIQLGYPVVQELPFDPSMILDQGQRKELKHYNLEHDLGILDLLTNAFEGKSNIPLGNLGTIQLRSTAVNKYKIPAWSWDAPKIASETLLRSYCEITDRDRKEVNNLRFNRPTIRFGDLFKDMRFDFRSQVFKDLFEEWMNSYDTFSKEFVIVTKSNHGLKISCGIGGLHNILPEGIYEVEEGYKILDIDIESLYPQLIILFNAFRFPEVLTAYKQFKEFRVTQTKPMLKKFKGQPEEAEWKNIDSFYKVILNGVSGHLDSEHSWLYNPEGIMKVRCGGQLILLTIIEKCWMNDITVIQANTDGITVKIRESKLDWFYEQVANSEKQYNVKFEYAEYSKMIFTSVNSYLAIPVVGKPKQKGSDFITNPELGSSVNFLVIPKMLELYFLKGINPETILASPEEYGLHIYDFCGSFKVNRDYTVIHNRIKQQRLNRFYVAKNAPFLYKQKDSKSKPDNMLKGWGVEIYNQHIEQPLKNYNLDMRYYLREARGIINTIENCQQITLF